MNFLKKFFNTPKPNSTSLSYEDFWAWFVSNQGSFYKHVKSQNNIKKGFFDKLSPMLNRVHDDIYYLTGMYSDNVVELVLTAEGVVKNFVFIEELIDAAPSLPNWKFTALKPALNIENVNIQMEGYVFSGKNISFYDATHPDYPDEISVDMVYHDYSEEDKNICHHGIHIFLDNYLGEVSYASLIDAVKIISREDATKELVPVSKLKDYLNWRQKEFIEKYEATRYDTQNDSYASMEAKTLEDLPIIAIINTDILKWDSKVSHPWLLTITLEYDGEKHNGLPDSDTYELLNVFEDEVLKELVASDGYLNIGRQTAEGERKIFFACKEFRKPSKVIGNLLGDNKTRIKGDYEIYKDKYWKSLNRFLLN